MKNVSREAVDQVLVDFQTEAGTQSTFGNGGDEYLKSVLNRALGEEKAGYLLDRILQGSDTSSIESLKWMDAPTVAELIKGEHPQIIASILVHLEREHAAEIINQFPQRRCARR